jgi:4-hydroxy-tetrahydrodipicolinate synthase
MITPLKASGELDESAARRVIDHVIAGGVDGVFVLGTTGECTSVPAPIRSRFVSVAAEHIRRRVPLYVGVGDNCLARSLGFIALPGPL